MCFSGCIFNILEYITTNGSSSKYSVKVVYSLVNKIFFCAYLHTCHGYKNNDCKMSKSNVLYLCGGDNNLV